MKYFTLSEKYFLSCSYFLVWVIKKRLGTLSPYRAPFLDSNWIIDTANTKSVNHFSVKTNFRNAFGMFATGPFNYYVRTYGVGWGGGSPSKCEHMQTGGGRGGCHVCI